MMDASVPQGTTRRIHVSLDQGETWNMAQLPSVGHEQFYSILAADDDLVFMHVDEPGSEWDALAAGDGDAPRGWGQLETWLQQRSRLLTRTQGSPEELSPWGCTSAGWRPGWMEL